MAMLFVDVDSLQKQAFRFINVKLTLFAITTDRRNLAADLLQIAQLVISRFKCRLWPSQLQCRAPRGACARRRRRENIATKLRGGSVMLSREDNELITRVGQNTAMGNTMRRYWIPALLGLEIAEPDGAPVRVRLLGEDLVAFRDTQGLIGLLDEYCPHRRASLWFGRNEECGLRCVYHGWKFDVAGAVSTSSTSPRPTNSNTRSTSPPIRRWSWAASCGPISGLPSGCRRRRNSHGRRSP